MIEINRTAARRLALVVLALAAGCRNDGSADNRSANVVVTPANVAVAEAVSGESRSMSVTEPASGTSVAPSSLAWNETATWTKFDSKLNLPWVTPGGDIGETIATLSLVDDDKPGWVEVTLPAGGAFIAKRTGGTDIRFASREHVDAGLRPQLVLADGRVLNPVADVSLNASTTASLGTSTQLSTQGGFLIRFDTTEGGRLRLHSQTEYGNQTLTFSRVAGSAVSGTTVAGSPVAAPAMLQTAAATGFPWTESASWTEYDSKLGLAWKTPGGDIGAKVATISLADDDKPGWVQIAIPAGGANFIAKRSGGTTFHFASREYSDPALRPKLVLADGRVLSPVADASLNSSTRNSLGTSTQLTTASGFLIRFDTQEAGTLRLYSLSEYGSQTITLSRVANAPVSVARPAWLPVDPTPVFTYADRRTVTLNAPSLTWLSAVKAIPAQTQACVTIYHKLHEDFRPADGGKLPGLSNTGQSVNWQGETVGGTFYAPTGWGGRSPDGIHWSARSGYGAWTDSHVARRTYFYAMSPHDGFGHVENIQAPITKGRFEAYVQCVKINTPGVADGGLYYEVAGRGGTYARNDIMWRTSSDPKSLIRELWVDYYCGGTSCGTGPQGTVTFVRAVVTKGLPDMAAVEAEVARLNAGG